MNIFFTGSPRALKTLREEHLSIYSTIESLGHTNLSTLVVEADPDTFYEREREKILKHYRETIDHLKKSDLVIAEVSLHSMSMGFIVNKCLELNKPILVMHLPDHDPFFLSGIENDKLQVLEYTPDTVEEILNEALDYARHNQDVRFNFFISPKISNYLDWIAKKKRLPRSVYIRNLIEQDMENNDDYR